MGGQILCSIGFELHTLVPCREYPMHNWQISSSGKLTLALIGSTTVSGPGRTTSLMSLAELRIWAGLGPGLWSRHHCVTCLVLQTCMMCQCSTDVFQAGTGLSP